NTYTKLDQIRAIARKMRKFPCKLPVFRESGANRTPETSPWRLGREIGLTTRHQSVSVEFSAN
ncbi:MAG: hypothetical protein LJE62_08805, partial [Silicimonas sp.]|nr:hypothetical protein [Silicimonas sp.]